MRKIIALLAPVAVLVLALCAPPAIAGTSPNAPLATNLTAVTDFSDEFPFVDLMKSARDWTPGNVAGCFDCRNPGGNPTCAAPNACPVAIDRDADGYVQSLAPGQVVTSIIHAGNTPGRLPAGNYTIRFDGAGSFQLLGANLVSQAPGEIVASVASSTGNNIGLRLTAITAGNHPRNIRILPPGGVCANDDRRACDAGNPCAGGAQCRLFTDPGVADQQVFQPRFLRNTEPYRLIRYMDWMETNSSPVVNPADYPRVTSAFWHRVPPEILAALGNRLASDIWINIPHRASDAFVDDFATRLRDSFRSDRRIFIEYSNENWNGIFSQNIEIPRQFCPAFPDLAAGCQNDGNPGNGIACERDPNTFSLGPAQGPCFAALVRAWGDRSVQIFDRFDTVFGASARQRLTRVVAAQAANADLGRQVLSRNATGQSFSVASRTDAYAIAPYFGTEYCTPDNGINPDSHPAVYANLDALMADLASRALPTAIGFMTANRQMLDQNFAASGLRLLAYEGGQHLAGIANFTFNATCNARFDAANADPRMGTLYQDYLAAWKLNGDEFAHFYNVGRWGPFGRWGLLEFQDQATATSPKFSAVQAFSAANPCWWPGCTQGGGAPPDPVFIDGFEGPAAPACAPAQLIADPGLEATAANGQSNPSWTSTSTTFGTVFCSAEICPNDGSNPAPRSGTFYAWFGGAAGAEASSLAQTVTIPAGAPRFLNFFLRRARVGAPADASLVVRIDGTTVASFDEPAAAEAAYASRSIDISPFATGAPRQVRFDYTNPAGASVSNFLVDDNTIGCTAPPP
jgi:hypothetical protein